MNVTHAAVPINDWLSGITASTGNFTQQRVKIELRGLMHLKRGDKTIYTTLSTTPSVTPTLEALVRLRRGN